MDYVCHFADPNSAFLSLYLNSEHSVVFQKLVIIQAVRKSPPFTKSKGPLNPILGHLNLAYVLTSFSKFLFNILLPSMFLTLQALSLFPNHSFICI